MVMEKMPRRIYTPVDDLSAEEKSTLDLQENEAREIYRRREELITRWRNISRFFKKKVEQQVRSKPGKGKKSEKIGVKTTTEPLRLFGLDEMGLEAIMDCVDREAVLEYQRKENPHSANWEKDTDRFIARNLTLGVKSILQDLRTLKKGDESADFHPERSADFYEENLHDLHIAREKLKKFQQELDDLLLDINMAKKAKQLRLVPMIGEEYHQKEREYLDYIRTDRLAFLIVQAKRLKQMKETFDKNGRIVETPYVQQMMARIEDVIDGNRPVFIHGELGSGKTALAKHLCVSRISSEYLDRWEQGNEELGLKAHPRPVRGSLSRLEYEKQMQEWENLRQNAAEPILISGHKEIDVETFIGGFKIERMKKMTPQEQVEFIKEEKRKYQEKYEAEILAGGDPNQLNKDLQLLERSLMQSFDSAVETTAYLGKFYRAMYEGRPIIIDEVNAIPHHVLIMLNELLTLKPGDTVLPAVDNLPSFKVAKGFSVILTGNWRPGSNKLYVGRQQMDAAFLSRLAIIPYDFLPNATDASAFVQESTTPEEEEERREQLAGNELTQMLAVRLMVNSGSGFEAPENAFQIINRLAIVARGIENVLSKDDVDRSFFPSTTNVTTSPKDILSENVLSLRHLIPIIEEWRENAYTRDLDEYLFLHYVERSQQRREEFVYLYEILQRVGGFFSPAKGWPSAASTDLVKLLDEFNVSKKMYGAMKSGDRRPSALSVIDTEVAPLKYFSMVDVVEQLFGKLPERKRVGKLIKPIKPEEVETDPLVAAQMKLLVDQLAEIDRKLLENLDGDREEITKKDLAQAYKCREDQVSLTKEEFLAGRDIVIHYGNLDLGEFVDPEGLVLPNQIAGNLDLSGLKAIKGLKFPDSVTNVLYLKNITTTEGLFDLPVGIRTIVFGKDMPDSEIEKLQKHYSEDLKKTFKKATA